MDLKKYILEVQNRWICAHNLCMQRLKNGFFKSGLSSIDTDSLSRLGDQGGIAREGKVAFGPL